MKGLLGLAGLLLTLAVVGVLVKKQLAAVSQPVPALTLPVPAGAASVAAPGTSQSPQALPQQYKQAVEGALQQARPMPDGQ
ncbi:MAG: hypothetical protein ACKVOO_11275 [Burkholderiaceae bacterium]